MRKNSLLKHTSSSAFEVSRVQIVASMEEIGDCVNQPHADGMDGTAAAGAEPQRSAETVNQIVEQRRKRVPGAFLSSWFQIAFR
jgi:hypothetical protein